MQNKRLKDYIIPSFIAGLCISLALFISNAAMYYTDNKIVAALAFSVGLIFCVFLGTDLFTGRTFTLTTDIMQKKKKWHTAFGLMGFILLFNIIGGIVISGLYALSAPGDDIKAIVENAALAKANLGVGIVFVRAILCNIFVAGAVYFSIKFKEKPGVSIAMIMLTIAPFIVLGFEHCIANVGAFSLALMLGTEVSAAGIVLNMTFAILGNYIGGLLIALLHAYKKYEY